MTIANYYTEANFITFLPSDDGSKITTPPPAATVVPTASSVTSVPIGEIEFVVMCLLSYRRILTLKYAWCSFFSKFSLFNYRRKRVVNTRILFEK